MTREEFMDIVYSELHSDGDNYRANRIIDAADEYAENLNKWIPVSERLPKENGDYLICYYDGYITVGYFQNEVGYYPKYWYNQQDEQIWDDDVIAWMPLPEPYKASPTVAESEVKE